MTLRHLLFRELFHRRWSFLLALLSVIVAVGCLVWQLTLLRLHDAATDEMVAAREQQTRKRVEELERDIAAQAARFEAETKQRLARLEDDYRKIMKNLGFNVLILPDKQDLSELHTKGHGSTTMPEEYVEKLAKSRIMTVNHLLPTVQQMIEWPEQKRTIFLVGTRGEVPILHADPKKPILEHVPRGQVVVGYELHQNLKLKKGDKLRFQGQELQVAKLHPKRGTRDDISLWINLGQAQEILNLKGQLHAILALECNCEADRLDKVKAEIQGILPDTQVVELHTQALARAEARSRAAREAQEARQAAAAKAALTRARVNAEARQAVAEVVQTRAALRERQQAFANVFLPLVLLVCIVWLGALTLGNVREREVEVGILRAIGLKQTQVLGLLLGRAVLTGLPGAGLGYGAALAGLLLGGADSSSSAPLFEPWLCIGVLLAAPALAVLVTWLAAILAARQDPAVILQEA